MHSPFLNDDRKFERYELLNILDFTSARKRMSVIVRKLDDKSGEQDGKVFLLAKGADNVIVERLSPGQEEFVKVTEDHLAEFASGGLRTLTLAYKVIPGAFRPVNAYRSGIRGTHSYKVSRGTIRSLGQALSRRYNCFE